MWLTHCCPIPENIPDEINLYNNNNTLPIKSTLICFEYIQHFIGVMNWTLFCSVYISVAYGCQSNMASSPVFYGIFTCTTHRTSQIGQYKSLFLLSVLISVENGVHLHLSERKWLHFVFRMSPYNLSTFISFLLSSATLTHGVNQNDWFFFFREDKSILCWRKKDLTPHRTPLHH